ncbi:MAG: MBL fold metallo-hydrolase [Caulobacteraceae bacterium]|nr:MBL fold metallo-hydrolase [Caulobacteraceae bacterium]
MKTELTFHGAAGCVTGFCARIRTDRAMVLVDCGLFQGPKTLKALNYQPFPFEVDQVDAVLLTHAHIDHSGQLPKLVKAGFRGPIYATSGTRALCEIMLADCGHIQESEVEHLNRRNERRGRALVEPIYTVADAAKAMRRFDVVKYEDWTAVAPGVRARWWNAGHILGSASIEVEIEEESGPLRLMFSGDLGPGGRDYLEDPRGPSGVDHLVVESTYGGTERPPCDPDQRRQALAKELRDAHAAGGPLLMPAFAVERTQELLADLVQIVDAGEAPAGEIFLDSPLAIKACEIFLEHGSTGSGNPFDRIRASGRLHYLERPADSDQLDRLRGWHIIMAGSGMCDAGRVRKHLKRLLWRREATVLLSGFQAVGTLGRLLADGRKTVRIEGEPYRVAARIRSLDLYSGHADAPALQRWVQARGPVAGEMFLAHGEPDSLNALRKRLVAAGLRADRIAIPTIDQAFRLEHTRIEASLTEPRLAPEAASELDWHNARSDFLNRLEEQLEKAGDDADRLRVLERLRRDLEAA